MALFEETTPRPLEYPLYNDTSESGAIGEGETVAPFLWSTDDPSERVLIALEVSLDEYEVLANTVDIGRDIAYNEKSWEVWWLWIRCYQMVDWCAQVLNCITNDEAIGQYLAQLIQDTAGNAQGTPLSPSQQQTALNNGAGDCDLDALWGSCLYTVQILNRLNMDFLESVEAATDNQELLSYFVGAVPVLETLPIDEIIIFADKVREFVKDFYEAGYDVDLEQEMACALFCRARANDCFLSMEVIVDYFWNEAGTFDGFDNVFQGALQIISAMSNWQEMVGEGVVVCLMACNVGFMHWLNNAFGMDFGHFKLQARSGIPDDDWEALCDECPAVGGCYTQTAAFANILEGEWVSDELYGRYARATEVGGHSTFEIAFDEPQVLEKFSMWTQAQPGASGGFSNPNAGSVGIYLAGDLIAVLFAFTRPNDWQYVWGQGATYIVDSTVGAGTTFDRIVFDHVYASTAGGAVRGTVCVEGAPPSSCADCETFAEETISMDATFTGGVWIPADERVHAESAAQYGGTYIAVSASGGSDEMFFEAGNSICANQVKFYLTPQGSVSGGTIDVTVNGVSNTPALPNPFNSPVICTIVLDAPTPVLNVVFKMTGGTSGINITQMRLNACAD